MTPAVQYVRASTGLQSCSLEQQVVANTAYAALRGFQILDTHADDGISGLTLTARPGLTRLLADALAPGRSFRAILVYDVSRWGRFQDIDEGAHYEFLCRQAGVAVHYCAEPFENEGSPEANLIKQVKRAMAAEYSRAQSDRVRHALRLVVARGFTASAPPFGYQRWAVDSAKRPIAPLGRGQRKVTSAHRTVFAPGPPEAVRTVRDIFRAYVLTGLSLPAIAAWLNATGAPSPTGRGWTLERLRRVLRREAYVGVYVYGRRRSDLGVLRVAPADSWQRVADAFPALVPQTHFERAQVLLRGGRRWRSDAELLSDLQELLALEGRLSGPIIDASPMTAQTSCYETRFGSLGAAFARIGYARRRARPPRRP